MSTQISTKQDPIMPFRKAWIDGLKAGDVNGLVALAADDIVCMSPNDTTVYGNEEFRSWWEEYFQYFKVTAFTEPERSVVITGDIATEISLYMIAITPAAGASRIRDDGRALTIWRRQEDGSWKVWQTLWNSTKPIGIGTNRYMSRLMQKKTRKKV